MSKVNKLKSKPWTRVSEVDNKVIEKGSQALQSLAAVLDDYLKYPSVEGAKCLSDAHAVINRYITTYRAPPNEERDNTIRRLVPVLERFLRWSDEPDGMKGFMGSPTKELGEEHFVQLAQATIKAFGDRLWTEEAQPTAKRGQDIPRSARIRVGQLFDLGSTRVFEIVNQQPRNDPPYQANSWELLVRFAEITGIPRKAMVAVGETLLEKNIPFINKINISLWVKTALEMAPAEEEVDVERNDREKAEIEKLIQMVNSRAPKSKSGSTPLRHKPSKQ